MGLGAAALGGISASSPAAFLVAATSLYVISVLIAPEISTLGLLVTKPLIDCFWDQKVGLFGVTEINLQSLIGIAVPATLLIAGLVRRWPYQMDSPGIWIAGYSVISAVGIIISPAKGAGLIDFIKIVSPFPIYWAARNFARERPRLTLVAWVLMLYGLVPLLSGLLELWGIIGPNPGAEPRVDGVVRVTGLYHHPLDISGRCGVALPFALFLGMASLRKPVRPLASLWAGLLAFGGYMTLARSAMAVTTAQLGFWLWATGRRTVAIVAIGLAVAALAIVGPARFVISDAIRPLREGAVYEFGTGRAFLFAAQVAGFRAASIPQKLVGRGLHSTQAVNVKFAPIPAEVLAERFEEGQGIGPHNQFLRVLGESGLIGLGIFVTSMVVVSTRIYRLIHNSQSIELKGFGIAVGTVIVAMAIYSLSLTPFELPSLSWPLWFSIGYLFGAYDHSETVRS